MATKRTDPIGSDRIKLGRIGPVRKLNLLEGARLGLIHFWDVENKNDKQKKLTPAFRLELTGFWSASVPQKNRLKFSYDIHLKFCDRWFHELMELLKIWESLIKYLETVFNWDFQVRSRD